MEQDDYRVCSRCKNEKPSNEFHSNGKYLRGRCKICEHLVRKERLSNKEYRDKHNELVRNWYNRGNEKDEKIRIKRYIKYRKYLDTLQNFAIQAYGGKCIMCGDARQEALVLHHVNGNGKEERLKHQCGTAFYRHLQKTGYPEGLEVLCGSCHLILHRKKRYEEWWQ